MSRDYLKIEEDLCRCCHSEGIFKNLAAAYNFGEEEEIYFNMLLETLDINITPASGPLCIRTYTICDVCILRLRDATTFKKQVLHCEKRFKHLYNNSLITLGKQDCSVVVKDEPPEEDTKGADEPSLLEYEDDNLFLKTDNDNNHRNRDSPHSPASCDGDASSGEHWTPADLSRDGMLSNTPSPVHNELPIFDKMKHKKILKKIKESQHTKNIEVTYIPCSSSTMPGPIVNDNLRIVLSRSDIVTSSLLNKTKETEHIKKRKRKTSIEGADEEDKLLKSAEECATNERVKNIIESSTEPIEQERKKKSKKAPQKVKPKSKPKKPPKKGGRPRKIKDIKEEDAPGDKEKTEDGSYRPVASKLQKLLTEGGKRPKFHLRDDDYRKEGDMYACARCDKRYDKIFSLKFHVKTKHYKIPRFVCPYCRQEFMTPAPLTVHKLQQHDVDDRFKCNACKGTFNTKVQLRKHINNFHMLGEKYKCEFCEYESFSFEGMYKHKFKHKTVKDYHCRFCRKSFLRKTTLDLHERIHTGDRRKVCAVCGQAFVQKASLNYHMAKYHPEVNF